jgi:integrase
LKPSSYRQYRAAIQQELRDLWDANKISLDDVERIAESMILTRDAGAPSPYAPKRSPLRTSAGRAKSIAEHKAVALSGLAAARKSAAGRNLADHLRFGPKFGLRNFEWLEAELEGTNLKVPCGKFSIPNGRGIAEYRTLSAQDLDADALTRLTEFLERLRSEMRAANGRGDLVLRRQSYLLRAIRDEANAPRVTLRTGRHQFTANMRKAGYSREETAAALGHAAADTSDDHYGKPNRGWQGLRRWIELPAELTSRVRPGAKTESRVRRSKPLTRSEWVASKLPAPGM